MHSVEHGNTAHGCQENAEYREMTRKEVEDGMPPA